jgi:hypothetical protein
MQSQAQMAYWQKDSKIAEIQNYNSLFAKRHGFYTLRSYNQSFHKKMKVLGTRDDKTLTIFQ